MNAEEIVLINAFEVPVGEDEAFLRGWERAKGFLATQPGYRSSQLHRSVGDNADFRYVNLAVWDSEDSFRAATAQPQFRGATTPYRFHASLYQVVRSDQRETQPVVQPEHA